MPTDAIQMLTEDHDKVRKLLSQLTDTGESAERQREDLLATIEKELKVHTKLEEEIFYPAFKESGGKEQNRMYFEAMEEHRAVEELVMPDLKKTDLSGTQFSGRAKVLKELIEHHAKEEEDEMFSKAREALSADQLQQLGERMAARKDELMQQI